MTNGFKKSISSSCSNSNSSSDFWVSFGFSSFSFWLNKVSFFCFSSSSSLSRFLIASLFPVVFNVSSNSLNMSSSASFREWLLLAVDSSLFKPQLTFGWFLFSGPFCFLRLRLPFQTFGRLVVRPKPNSFENLRIYFLFKMRRLIKKFLIINYFIN